MFEFNFRDLYPHLGFVEISSDAFSVLVVEADGAGIFVKYVLVLFRLTVEVPADSLWRLLYFVLMSKPPIEFLLL
jgi:hypothetical protein